MVNKKAQLLQLLSPVGGSDKLIDWSTSIYIKRIQTQFIIKFSGDSVMLNVATSFAGFVDKCLQTLKHPIRGLQDAFHVYWSSTVQRHLKLPIYRLATRWQRFAHFYPV